MPNTPHNVVPSMPDRILIALAQTLHALILCQTRHMAIGDCHGSVQITMTSKKIRNMDEFASLSGISRPTISKYFNDPNSVSHPPAIDRSALKEQDYRPNIYAMNQNRRLTKNIALSCPTC